MKKKLLIVMTTLYNGGAERSLVNLLTELPSDKYEVDLLLFKREGMFVSQVPSNVNFLETPSGLKKMYGPLKNAGLMIPWKLAANVISRIAVRKDREQRYFRWKHFYSKCVEKVPKHYDVALSYVSGEVMYFVDEMVDADKKIVWIHNDYRSAGHPKQKDYPYFERMSGIVSISEACVDILKEEFPAFKDKIYMLENITSSIVVRNRAEEFYPSEYDENGSNILSIGRLSTQKGFDMAIDAAAVMKSKGVTFKWFVIGNGELESELKQRIEKNGVEDCFILLGPRENPYPYIKHCTVFAQTSRFEGKSVVLDEAKILGAPILATNYPTVCDQLTDQVSGKIVKMDAEHIAEGLSEMLDNEDFRKKLSDYLTSREWGNQKEIEKYMELIDK